jgi:hypothetical protein
VPKWLESMATAGGGSNFGGGGGRRRESGMSRDFRGNEFESSGAAATLWLLSADVCCVGSSRLALCVLLLSQVEVAVAAAAVAAAQAEAAVVSVAAVAAGPARRWGASEAEALAAVWPWVAEEAASRATACGKNEAQKELARLTDVHCCSLKEKTAAAHRVGHRHRHEAT